MSMCVGLAGEAVEGVRSKERRRRQGREEWTKGLKVVRKVVMVWSGRDILLGVVVVQLRWLRSLVSEITSEQVDISLLSH
jgi:hypothetical protein